MLLACMFCAALHSAAAAFATPAQHQIPVPQPPSAAPPAQTPGQIQLPHFASPMTANQRMAMQIYASNAVNSANTAAQAFKAAAEAKNAGYEDLAKKEMKLARHGAANAAISKAELISGEATLNHSQNAEAALAEFHEKLHQEQLHMVDLAGAAQDEPHKKLYRVMSGFYLEIEADPGRYAAHDGADALAGGDGD